MKLFNPKTRIATGLIGILISLIMLAFFLNIIPDRNSALMEGRAALAEAIAVYSTALVKTANSQRLKDDFNLLSERNNDLLSLALRRESGNILVSSGDHIDQWKAMPGEYSRDSQVQVPIWAGKQKWGQLELRFKPLSGKGILNFLTNNPMIKMILFMGVACFILYYFYLGKVLRQLDPSQAIPGRVREALDTMAEGLLILDRKEQIVLANSAFAFMINKSPDGLLGYRAGELPWMDTTGKKLEKTQRPWVKSLIHGKIQKDNIIRLKITGEDFRTFKTNCSPVLGDSGKYAGVLVSLDDITEIEEKEIALRHSKLEAEEANKAKSTFLANMSHEIRTPMNAILGFTEILKRGYVKNETESLKYLNTIHSSGKNLLELINDILDLSKVESGRIEIEKLRVEPYSIIQEVIQMLAVKANEKGITLDFFAHGDLPKEVETDPARLRQIAFNLIGNSIKFTEKGGVTVTCHYKATGPYLIMDITDTGIGMSEKALKNIFDPFVQADSSVTRRFGGTGLGLAISRKFAQAMGGDITVESEMGKGSTFTVSIATGDLSGTPFIAPEELTILQRETATGANVRWQFPDARVLVVDDGEQNRELVKLLLEEAGLTVDEAENGQIGVEKAVAINYNAILMDVQMPIMDGFTAAGILRKKGLKIPVIALTASAMKGFEEQCLAAGYSGYLSKPIDIDQFMELMAKLLDGVKQEKGFADPTHLAKSFQDTLQVKEPVTDLNPIFSRLPAGNKKFRNIIKHFVSRLDEQLNAMEAAQTRGDTKELASLAHWLKGAGGTVGFDVFTEPAAQLEDNAKNENGPEIKASITNIRALAARIVIPKDETTVVSTAETNSKNEIRKETSITANPSALDVQKPVISRFANNKRLQPIVLRFIETLDKKIEIMDEALQNENMTELASLAHWLKGAGGTVGYDEFTKPAEDLETFAKANHLEMAGQLLEKVKSIVQSIIPPDSGKKGNE